MPDFDAGFKFILGNGIDHDIAVAHLFIVGFPDEVAECIGNAEFSFSVNRVTNVPKSEAKKFKKWEKEQKKVKTFFNVNGFFFKYYGDIPVIVFYGYYNGQLFNAKARLDPNIEDIETTNLLVQRLMKTYNNNIGKIHSFPVECSPYIRSKK